MKAKTNLASLVRANRSENHNTELKHENTQTKLKTQTTQL